jgi:glycosyltransferase involved in cell wall biosynthesis
MTTVSIIICSRNRSTGLATLLAALASQSGLISSNVEIVVVDDGSTDTTKFVVDHFTITSPVKTLYLSTPPRGLAAARNTGALQASGDILCFTDDDCIPEHTWLESTVQLFEAHHCDAIGGRSLASSADGVIPGWVSDNLDLLWGAIGHYDLGPEWRKYTNDLPPFIGANMSISAECFRSVGPFRVDLGHGTGRLGEDTEYFNRLCEANKCVWYNGRSHVRHVNGVERFTVGYMVRWHWAKFRFLMRCPVPKKTSSRWGATSLVPLVVFRCAVIAKRIAVHAWCRSRRKVTGVHEGSRGKAANIQCPPSKNELRPYFRVHAVPIVVAFLVCGWFLFNRFSYGTWDPSAHFAWWYRGYQITSVGMEGGLRFDRESRNEPLRVGGVDFLHGISVSAYSTVALKKRTPFRRLRGLCGVSDSACNKRTSVICQVLIGGKVVFHSGLLRYGQAAVPFEIAVEPSHEFQLVVHEVSFPKWCTRVNWLELTTEF